jgi:hypothetical protein
MDEGLLNDENIQRYVDGEMSPSEREQFEGQLAHNEALKEAVARAQLTIKAVQYAAIADRVKNIHHRLAPSLTQHAVTSNTHRIVPFRTRMLRITLAVAASVLIIVLGAGAHYVYQLSPDTLYNETYIPYSLSGTRSAESAQVSSIESAYQQKDYKSVIAYAQGKNLTGAQRLLTSLAYLQLNQAPAAIEQLNALLQTSPTGSSLRQDAEYYLALAYLKNKQYDKALPLMQAIHQNTDHPYHDQFTSRTIREVQLLQWKQ